MLGMLVYETFEPLRQEHMQLPFHVTVMATEDRKRFI